jgi:hypothetical protein
LLVVLVPIASWGALSPQVVKEAKEKAPLHLIGVVQSDATYRDLSAKFGHPLEIRKMTLQVKSLSKKPSDLTLAAGDTVDVYYDWYPASEQMTGGVRIDVLVGDELELWLKKGQDGWEPALGGDTVHGIKLVQPRPTTAVPLTTSERLYDLWHTYWVPILFIAIMGIFAGMVYLRAARK